MTALTVRLPDEKHRRLKALAKSRGTPLNRLIDDMTTVMLAEFDAETRFRLRAARGEGQEALGLRLLDKAMQVELPPRPELDVTGLHLHQQQVTGLIDHHDVDFAVLLLRLGAPRPVNAVE